MVKKFSNTVFDIDKIETGRRLKLFRNSVPPGKITIKELSKATGLSGGMISETETGKSKPSPNLLLALLNLYHLNINWLLRGKGDMFINSEKIPFQFKEISGDRKICQLIEYVMRFPKIRYFMLSNLDNLKIIFSKEIEEYERSKDHSIKGEAG